MINSPFQPGDFSTGFTTTIIIIYLVFSSLEELMQTKVYFKLFYSVWKETSQKPLKVAAATTSFSGVCIIVKTCFDECFLLHIITGRHYFLYKFVVTQRFGTAAMLLHSLKQVFWKKSAFYTRYLLNNISMLLMSKIKVFLLINVPNKIYLLTVFFTFSVCECFTFFIINGIFKG